MAKYHTIEKEGYASAHLFYNMGTTYFHIEDTAQSILYLEKAKHLAPIDKQITHNLKLAYLKTHNEYEPIPTLSIVNQYHHFLMLPAKNRWLYVALGFNVLGFLFLFLYKLKAKPFFKLIGVLSIVLCVFTLFIHFQQHSYLAENKFAIVNKTIIPLKAEPNQSAKDVLNVYKGYKVELKDSLDNWYLVSFNNEEAWIEKANILRIE